MNEIAKTRDQVLVECMPMVRYAARKIGAKLPSHIDFEDLVGAGTLGLIDAYSRYDASLGTTFKTFAQTRVGGSMLDYLRSLDIAPRELRKQERARRVAVEDCTKELGRHPSDLEVAEKMGVSIGEYHDLVCKVDSLQMEEMDAEVEGVPGLAEKLAGPADDSPLAQFLHREKIQRLRDAVSNLDAREQKVLNWYYCEDQTMSVIAKKVGYSESRVSQIHTQCLHKLKDIYQNPSAYPERITMSEFNRQETTAQQPLRVFASRICRCGCGQSFTPTGGAHVFVVGHRAPSPPAKTQKRFDTRTTNIVEAKTPADVDQKMVTITVSEGAIEKLLALLPLEMKAKAVAGILESL